MSVRILTAAVLLCAALAPAATARPFPETIPLPDGWQPEGIAIGHGNDVYVGSIPTGSIWKGDLRTGRGDVFISRSGRNAIGIKFDRKRKQIVVAGGPSGMAWVYSARSGRDVAAFRLTTDPTFVNDVALARGKAYFTDSINQRLYVLDGRKVRTLPLTGDLMYDEDPGTFELNGIAPTRDGKRLIAVQSRNGKLFEIDPRDGDTDEIELSNGNVANGDGLLVKGRTLYVVQNRLNQIAVVDLRRGRIERLITDPDFDVPTTIARKGDFLWAPNARFGTPPTPATEYDIVRVRR